MNVAALRNDTVVVQPGSHRLRGCHNGRWSTDTAAAVDGWGIVLSSSNSCFAAAAAVADIVAGNTDAGSEAVVPGPEPP